MLMPKKNRIAIYELLFKEGVMVAKKDVHMPKHPELVDKNVPNLHVMKAMQVGDESQGLDRRGCCVPVNKHQQPLSDNCSGCQITARVAFSLLCTSFPICLISFVSISSLVCCPPLIWIQVSSSVRALCRSLLFSHEAGTMLEPCPMPVSFSVSRALFSSYSQSHLVRAVVGDVWQ